MEVEDNLTKQADEVEALSAIYADDWCIVDEAARIYAIQITGEQSKQWTVDLQVTMPPEYPSSSPPHYQLNAPLLRGEDKFSLQNSLEEIFCENPGEIIIFLWVERIREFMQEWTVKQDKSSANTASNIPVNITSETDFTGVDGAENYDCSHQMAEMNISTEEETGEEVECPEIFHGGTVSDRRSVFQAHLAAVTSRKQVKLVMDKLKENKKVAVATHNIIAYRIRDSKGNASITGCVDDGETHAGSRMLHLLQMIGVDNVLVVVSRWYGGVHLGPDRFKHINNCTRNILEQCGYLKEKSEKKGPRSNKKR